MGKTLKTAPELERLILNELRRCAACNGIAAVTVALAESADANWEVSHVAAAGGAVPPVCTGLCDEAAAHLRARYDLVVEIEPEDM